MILHLFLGEYIHDNNMHRRCLVLHQLNNDPICLRMRKSNL
jgi:hypothetical protein